MKIESKRIFICDLPETATPDIIQAAFEQYGTVTNIDIKERKELGSKNTSLFYAFVTLDIDDRSLNSCFRDFSNAKWLGQHIILEVARESFLDRLKRERDSNQNKIERNEPSALPATDKNSSLSLKGIKTNHVNRTKEVGKKTSFSDASSSESAKVTDSPICQKKKRLKLAQEEVTDTIIKNKKGKLDGSKTTNVKKMKNKVKESSSSETSSSDNEEATNSPIHQKNKKLILSQPPEEEITDFIIKNNKGKYNEVPKILKIESVGKKPIFKIEKSDKKPINNSDANLKRLESLKRMKAGYQQQKSLIQVALSQIDNTKKNKIVFSDDLGNNEQSPTKTNKNLLFDESEPEEDIETHFTNKEHFLGKEGKKLLELQSKFKGDKRFTLDKRFLDENDENEEKSSNNIENNDELTLEEEKKKEYEILEKVLGNSKVRQDEQQISRQQKSMKRFDPSKPEHSKYEIQQPTITNEKKKRKKVENDIDEKRQEEKEAPEVSKEVFFKVSTDLKKKFEEKKEFSLLSMFGNPEENKSEDLEESADGAPIQKHNLTNGKNPFKYDSSDNEDENEKEQDKTGQNAEVPIGRRNQQIENRSYTDPFFFRIDDYRLQEGFDFILKMASEERSEFSKLRRDLKEIVKSKIRNNTRKNTPFKKKLGGSKKKKVLKLKKAMKK